MMSCARSASCPCWKGSARTDTPQHGAHGAERAKDPGPAEQAGTRAATGAGAPRLRSEHMRRSLRRSVTMSPRPARPRALWAVPVLLVALTACTDIDLRGEF